MKKIRKIICLIIALAALFVFSGVAFAYFSEDAYWNSTTCLYGFTTANSISKPSTGLWYTFFIETAEAYWPSGDPNWENYVLTTFKSSSGVIMSVQIWGRVGYPDSVDCNETYNNLNPVKMRIDNPHPGYNMISNGKFYGTIY